VLVEDRVLEEDSAGSIEAMKQKENDHVRREAMEEARSNPDDHHESANPYKEAQCKASQEQTHGRLSTGN